METMGATRKSGMKKTESLSERRRRRHRRRRRSTNGRFLAQRTQNLAQRTRFLAQQTQK